ncbi:hypothetical protein QCA50_015576 [Cerrena zonata]|uniref:Aminoglycoside phosphotransferase domain-containing protein n=1 Tax=Cerrena zonata TaxID=2478898 RepID=A0AAW0FR00_9APHY
MFQQISYIRSLCLATLFNLYLLTCGFYHGLRRKPNDPFYYGRLKFILGRMVLKSFRITNGAPEADTLRYIRANTTIPVPRVYASAEGYGRRFLLMEEIKGDCLENVWITLNDTQKDSIVQSLQSYISQLRSLSPPHGRKVCALNGEAVRDSRITSSGPVGPFADEANFNDYLVQAAEVFMDETTIPGIRARMREDHRIVFTHGDLAPRNIIVKDGKVMALIDWEQSGWYPEHWELVKAMWCPMGKDDLSWDNRIIAMFSEENNKDWRIDRELSDHLVGGF